MKSILLLGLSIGFMSCLEVGNFAQYAKNPSRTSNVIRDSFIKATVVAVDQDNATFRLDVYLKPILGRATNRSSQKVIPLESFNEDNLQALRDGEVFEEDTYRMAHRGFSSDGCDLIIIDKIPDDQDIKNLIVKPKVCVDQKRIPTIDVSFVSKNRNIQIGYDLVRSGFWWDIF